MLKSDCEKMMINPLEKGDILLLNPKLKSYDEFQEDIEDKDPIIRYIAIMYDMESPMKKEGNLLRKKIDAIQQVGIDPKSKTGMMIMRNRSPVVNAMIVRYCRMQHSLDFTKFVMMEEALYNEYLTLQNEDESLLRQHIISNISKLDTSLKEMSSSIFGGIREEDLEIKMFELIEGEIELGLRPEDMATNEVEQEFDQDEINVPVRRKRNPYRRR
jgi:hypothetical protein